MSTQPKTFKGNARDPLDFYETPIAYCRWAIEKTILPNLSPTRATGDGLRILDAGAGTGRWGEAAREAFPDAWICGVEVNRTHKRHDAYDAWQGEDFLHPDWGFVSDFDIILGNPPYSIKARPTAEQFIAKGLSSLRDGGVLSYLLKIEFAGSARRNRDLFSVQAPTIYVPLPTRIPFYAGLSKTNTIDYAQYVFVKNLKTPYNGCIKWAREDWRTHE